MVTVWNGRGRGGRKESIIICRDETGVVLGLTPPLLHIGGRNDKIMEKYKFLLKIINDKANT